MRKRTLGYRGFTLIELLVVIAIIAILAAMIFPVFSRARQAARKATCSANLKQLALAMTMYDDEYGKMLFARCGVNYGLQQWEQNGSFMSYTKSGKLNACPSISSWGDAANGPTTGSINTGYGMNFFLQAYPAGYAIDRARNPEKVLLFVDSLDPWAGRVCNTVAGTDGTPTIRDKFSGTYERTDGALATITPTNVLAKMHMPSAAFANACAQTDWNDCTGIPDYGVMGSSQNGNRFRNKDYTRHQGGSNVAFLDGHVKFVTFEKITYERMAGEGFPAYNPNLQ